MNRRLQTMTVVLALAFAGCGGVRETIRSQPITASNLFDSAELVDVLPPDTVPAIDRPSFEERAQAAERLQPSDPVAVLDVGGEARAYPLAILVWHEVVNDSFGGEPIAVTYSPLSGAAVAFRRTIPGRVLTFGGSGKLYRSNLVMYDRATRSLWPQLRGEAVLGPLAGAALERIPLQIGSFGGFSASYPDGKVLTAVTGAARVYGATPYAGYDSRRAPSDSFFTIAPDRRLGAMDRVLGVATPTESRAYPYEVLRTAGVVYDRISGGEVLLLWRAGARSALDTPLIAEGRDVGSAGAFDPTLDGTRLELSAAPGGFRDAQTGSTWSELGVATAGPLKGKRLTRVAQTEAFWFAWAAFVPSTSIFGRS